MTYDWIGTGTTGGGGTFGVGSMTLDIGAQSTTNFIVGVPNVNPGSSLVSLAYTWNNGTSSRTITRSDVTFSNNVISAVNGVLSNFVLSNFPTNSFALSVAPSSQNSVGISEMSSTGAFLDRDQGAWRLAAVPEPEGWALMIAGLLGFGAIVRRRA